MIIDIQTGSRLHFGLICGSQMTGWQFGGIGVMLRSPSWRLSFSTTLPLSGAFESDLVTASPEATARVHDYMTQIRRRLPMPQVTVTAFNEIPFHTGLGSGTQLGLAIAAAAHLLVTRQLTLDPCDLARLAQRAERSAIGSYGFRDGGFLIDYGLSATPAEARRVERLRMPESWCFLLVRPKDTQGLSGEGERKFFDQRVQMPAALVRELGEIITQRLAPSVRHGDFEAFSVGLEVYGNTVGNFYAVEQGDVFAHPAIRQLVADLRAQGIYGAAQSSWGPGISIPAHSFAHAQAMAQLIPVSEGKTDFAVEISEPMNIGASIRTRGPETHEGTLA